MNDGSLRQIRVPLLTRVEGEGALDIIIEHDQISHLALRIFEPPRFFEQLLRGRHFDEVPDIVARICGICPVAYQMSAVHALERLFDIDPGPWVRDMRRVYYCGEWIESHSLHMHLLALLDYLGYPHAIAMAADHGDAVRRGLRLQAAGNALIRLFGMRSVHPVGARVGGFYSAPSSTAVTSILNSLEQARHDAQALLAWVATLSLPQSARECVYVSLTHPTQYPMNEGQFCTSEGDTFSVDQFDDHFAEFQAPHSTALHCLYHGRSYLVGPLARINHSAHLLNEDVRETLKRSGVSFPSSNPFHSLIARAAEIYHAVLEAQRLLLMYTPVASPSVSLKSRAGIAIASTEAPRGTLWHRFEVDERGLITHARIVPPTSQNQAQIESDLRADLMAFGVHNTDDDLRRRAEQLIRSYDPCISCATHFLRLTVERR